MMYASRSAHGAGAPRPPSPTLSNATTQASALNMNGGPDIIITRAHLRTSVATYEELLRSCSAYRDALSALSNASAQYASAIEACSRLRGVGDDASVGFQAISGLHYLIANQERVLSESIRSQFDEPLRAHLKEYKARIAERSAAYEQSLIEKNRIIRKTEAENMSVGRRGRQRDLNSFRAALTTLQKQVSDLDQLKAEYYTEVLAHEEETWDAAMEKVALVTRSSLEVYDRISAKSSDPSLEPILQAIPDPFDAYGPQKAEDEIFSILPVGSILSNVTNTNTNRSTTSSPTPSTVASPASASPFAIDPSQDQHVRSWMDQAAAARSGGGSSPPGLGGLDWYSGRSISALAHENGGHAHGPVDWTDTSDARVRRHSLPTKPVTLLNGVASSSSVPFPSPSDLDSPSSPTSTSNSQGTGTGTIRPRGNREQSKLRNTLSIMGESGTSSSSQHSRDSTVTATGAGIALGGGVGVEDDDTSTERGSDHNSGEEEEEAQEQVDGAHSPTDDDATVLIGKSSESEPPSPSEDAPASRNEVVLDTSSISIPPWA